MYRQMVLRIPTCFTNVPIKVFYLLFFFFIIFKYLPIKYVMRARARAILVSR